MADVDVLDAKRRWKEGLPCNLKQMAVALEISYSVVRNWARMEGFPMLKGFVFPDAFKCWRDDCFVKTASSALLRSTHVAASEALKSSEAPTPSTRQAEAIYKMAGLR